MKGRGTMSDLVDGLEYCGGLQMRDGKLEYSGVLVAHFESNFFFNRLTFSIFNNILRVSYLICYGNI